jgi:hypothetical protein|nr:MAG TPA: tail assembly chaperone [Caudoviricetes sp.]
MGFFDNYKDKNVAAVEVATQDTEALEGAEATKEEEKVVEMPKKKPFAIWNVKGEDYKMVLGTQDIVALESKYKTNLMNIMGAGNAGMPALSVMLDVAHAALKKFHHGISKDAVMAMFDQYIKEGGSQLNFYTEVYMQIFQVSGFFSVSLTNQMQSALEDAKTVL